MTRESLPDWLIPPEGGFTAEDLDRLPDLPRHTELIDGSLVFVSPQRLFHMAAIDLLRIGLLSSAPEHLTVAREMTVTLARNQRPEPDLMVVRADAITGMDLTTFQPADVLLAVEVESPDSLARDRERKPQLYARAGIPHYWRVESDSGRPVVFVYELDAATGSYADSSVHREHLKLTAPYEIDIDLTAIGRR